MKSFVSTKMRITMLTGGAVVVILMLLLLIFNMGMYGQIDDRARQAIESSLSDNLSQSSAYYAEWIFLPEDNDDLLDSMYISKTDRRIIHWCSKHKTGDEIQQCEIENRRYYLKTMQEYDKELGRITYIAYVDVSNELYMVRHMNLLFLAAALIVGFVVCFMGYRLGIRLERSETAQKMFFENASHELKTPLAVIRGYAEGIEKEITTDITRAGKEIAAQTDKMSHLVEDILLLSKLEAQSQPLQNETFQINELLEDCLMPLEEIITARKIELRLDLTPARIFADPEKMECVITNLLTNAIRYCHGTISIACDAGHLVIWNNCDPVPREDVDRLFDRFYTGGQGNTGIGLALAKEIILQHGFRLRAENRDDGLAIEIVY